ncbi:UNVERIFIED_CONTAM: hypothetical protein HHA_280810 [Hammondia hammondi]|eukprot:XP_008885923.1 hypothetical protein HHA_280810 [Hammondia hammondi]
MCCCMARQLGARVPTAFLNEKNADVVVSRVNVEILYPSFPEDVAPPLTPTFVCGRASEGNMGTTAALHRKNPARLFVRANQIWRRRGALLLLSLHAFIFLAVFSSLTPDGWSATRTFMAEAVISETRGLLVHMDSTNPAGNSKVEGSVGTEESTASEGSVTAEESVAAAGSLAVAHRATTKGKKTKKGTRWWGDENKATDHHGGATVDAAPLSPAQWKNDKLRVIFFATLAAATAVAVSIALSTEEFATPAKSEVKQVFPGARESQPVYELLFGRLFRAQEDVMGRRVNQTVRQL